MAPIDQSLLAKITGKLRVKERRAYQMIEDVVRTRHLPRNIAALIVASEAGVNISRFASDEDLTLMRTLRGPQPPEPTPGTAPPAILAAPSRRRKDSGKYKQRGNNYVFVVHGRNEKIRRSLFAFLRSVSVLPIEWNKAIELTKKGTPYVGEVLDAAFKKARAIVVLFTPDDEAKLKAEFIAKNDPSFERRLTGQPRPNVLFEAGMAFGRNANSTVLVQVGKIRAMSDVAGRHAVHLTNSHGSRHQLIVKLRAAGCTVDDAGEDWQTTGDFSL